MACRTIEAMKTFLSASLCFLASGWMPGFMVNAVRLGYASMHRTGGNMKHQMMKHKSATLTYVSFAAPFQGICAMSLGVENRGSTMAHACAPSPVLISTG